jgi:ribonuclease PH
LTIAAEHFDELVSGACQNSGLRHAAPLLVQTTRHAAVTAYARMTRRAISVRQRKAQTAWQRLSVTIEQVIFWPEMPEIAFLMPLRL